MLQNFVLSCVTTQKVAELDESSNGNQSLWRQTADLINYFFTLVFVIDVGLRWCIYLASAPTISGSHFVVHSLFALWFKPFFSQPWKVFDLLIIISSVVGLTPWVDVPSEVRKYLKAPLQDVWLQFPTSKKDFQDQMTGFAHHEVLRRIIKYTRKSRVPRFFWSSSLFFSLNQYALALIEVPVWYRLHDLFESSGCWALWR